MNRQEPTHDPDLLAAQIAAGEFASAPSSDTRMPAESRDKAGSVSQASDAPRAVSEDFPADSVSQIAFDVELFLRGWIGRFRQVIIRASQLAEQEEMLKNTLAAVDAQQAEWHRRTIAKENDLAQQTKMLTDAWMTLEKERRAKLQSGSNPSSHGIAALPATTSHPVIPSSPPAVADTAPTRNPVGSPATSPTSSVPDLQREAPAAAHAPASDGKSLPNPADASLPLGEAETLPPPAITQPAITPPAITQPSVAQPPMSSVSNEPDRPLVVNQLPMASSPPPVPNGNAPIANPTIQPIDPWKSSPPDSLDQTSDAVKQFQRLRRDMRGKNANQ